MVNLLEDIYFVDSFYIVLNVYRKNVFVDKFIGKKIFLVSKEFEKVVVINLKKY